MKILYDIVIVTSNGYADAGTDSTVETQFVGENGKTTQWYILDEPFYDNFEKGSTDKFNIVMEDVGIPAIIRFRITHGKKFDGWLCNYVKVIRKNEHKIYPFYCYIDHFAEIIDSDTELPQKMTEEIVAIQRKKNLYTMKEKVQWFDKEEFKTYSPGMVRCIHATCYEELPSFMQKYSARQHDFKRGTTVGVLAGKYETLCSNFTKISNLESYHRFHRKLDKMANETPDFLRGWDTDEGFGWQILNGILPLGFKRVTTKLPDYFNVTNDDLAEVLGDKTIESEIEDGNLYLTDYSDVYTEDNGLIYKPQTDGKPCTVAPAVGLFHVNSDGDFVPIAIQLKPNDRDYLFTPDWSHDWLLAKMYFRNASFSIHEWIYHFLYTHGSVEPFQIAAYRCLSIAHPIYKLLRPHVRTVAAINAQARHGLVPPTSVAATGICVDATSMMKHYYKTFHMDHLNIPKTLKEAGIDPDKIPTYHYGQDTLKLWKIVRNYVAGIVNIFYENDQDVVEDFELQEYIHEVAYEGFGWEDNNTRGFPSEFKTREELIENCTIVIATSSVQHAAVNFGQYESGKFAPNYPGLMNLPPHKKGEANMKRIMDALPNIKQMFGVLALTFALSKYSEAEEWLGEFNECWFYEKEPREVQRKFQQDLKEIEEELQARNKTVRRPYIHQLPSQIPNSVAI